MSPAVFVYLSQLTQITNKTTTSPLLSSIIIYYYCYYRRRSLPCVRPRARDNQRQRQHTTRTRAQRASILSSWWWILLMMMRRQCAVSWCARTAHVYVHKFARANTAAAATTHCTRERLPRAGMCGRERHVRVVSTTGDFSSNSFGVAARRYTQMPVVVVVAAGCSV